MSENSANLRTPQKPSDQRTRWRKTRIFLLCGIMVLLLPAVFFAVQEYKIPSKVTMNHHETRNGLDFAGFTFSTPTTSPALTNRDIYNLVKKQYASALESCSSLNIDYQLVTSPNLANRHLQDTPAYIVSFHDLIGYSFGSDEVSNRTLYVVFDANSGEELYAETSPL